MLLLTLRSGGYLCKVINVHLVRGLYVGKMLFSVFKFAGIIIRVYDANSVYYWFIIICNGQRKRGLDAVY